jgi:hypothetical protein
LKRMLVLVFSWQATLAIENNAPCEIEVTPAIPSSPAPPVTRVQVALGLR